MSRPIRVGFGWVKRPANPRVSGVLLSVTDDIQGQDRLGYGKRPSQPWFGGVLLSVIDDIQD